MSPANAVTEDDMVSVADLRRKLAYHLVPGTDPCQDHGCDWPCDVATALGVTGGEVDGDGGTAEDGV